MVEAYRQLLGGAMPAPEVDLRGALEVAAAYVLLPDGSDRLRLAVASFGYFRDHRWLGAGFGNTPVFAVARNRDRVDIYYYPHNILLEQLAVGGIVGFALFAAPAVGALLLVLLRAKGEQALLAFFCYLVFVFVTACLSGNYFDFRVYWAVALIAALAVPPQTAAPAPRANS